MNKEEICIINFTLVWAYFFSNILFLISNTDMKEVVIVELFATPILYLMFYIIGKLVDKNYI